MTSTHTNYDAAVVGAGPTGLAVAVALAQAGLRVALADGRQAADAPAASLRVGDHRTAALFPPALDLLRNLGIPRALWQGCSRLDAIRLIDMTGGLLRAPEVVFHARELGLDRLALNVPNAALSAALDELARQSGVAFLLGGRACTIVETARECRVTLEDGSLLEAEIVVGADGRNSACRKAADICAKSWSYEQAALVTTFTHSRPHHGVSTEIHAPAGPCTTVPLPGNHSSLVWVERPALVDRLAQMTSGEFEGALQDRLAGLLGAVTVDGPRQTFPLSALVADTMARGRIALVGEAGHALPPIGAQGLNLGLADVAVLADVLAAWKTQPTVAPMGMLQRYASLRAGDIARRTQAVDLLNRTLESGSTALHLLRGAGLHLLSGAPALRRLLMAQGLEPPHPLPALMRVSDARA